MDKAVAMPSSSVGIILSPRIIIMDKAVAMPSSSVGNILFERESDFYNKKIKKIKILKNVFTTSGIKKVICLRC
jgi:hypothetical protein